MQNNTNTNLKKTADLITNLHRAIEDGDSGITAQELDDLLVRARVSRQIFTGEALT